jgi:phosphatidate cytidylyltransferase
MNNFISRLIILIIFFPLLFVVIFLLPFWHHLIFNTIVTVVALVGAFEIKKMLEKKGIPTFRVLPPFLSASLPAAAYLEGITLLPQGAYIVWVAIIVGVYMVITICVSTEAKLGERLPLFSSSLVILILPSFFLSFIVMITNFIHPEIALLFLIFPVFVNDIFAYLAGKLTRGWSRLNMIISPNKSLIGFISGFTASLGTTLVLALALNDYYIISPWAALLLGAAVGGTAILGDLFESALKRSCHIKDSGVVMGGRGGIMDAIDSLLLSAPVFFCLFPLMAVPAE